MKKTKEYKTLRENVVLVINNWDKKSKFDAHREHHDVIQEILDDLVSAVRLADDGASNLYMKVKEATA